ncbi:hypothetical protein [Avibacterium endocarditidis]|nr:hypothetical protein [Avibacterium endocarditidis]
MKKLRNSQYLASFMIGIGSILNVAPIAFLPINTDTPNNDKTNLQKDWQAVGGYLYKAMETLDNDRTTSNYRS